MRTVGKTIIMATKAVRTTATIRSENLRVPRPAATTSWRLVVNRSRDDLRSVRSARGDFGGVSGFDRAEERRILSPPVPSGLGLLGAFSGRLDRRFPSRLAERPGGRRGEPEGGVRRAFMPTSLLPLSEGLMYAAGSWRVPKRGIHHGYFEGESAGEKDAKGRCQ